MTWIVFFLVRDANEKFWRASELLRKLKGVELSEMFVVPNRRSSQEL